MEKKSDKKTKTAYYVISIILPILILAMLGSVMAYNICLKNIPANYGLYTNCAREGYCQSVGEAMFFIISYSNLLVMTLSLVGVIMIIASTIRSKKKWPPKKEQIILGVSIILSLIGFFLINS